MEKINSKCPQKNGIISNSQSLTKEEKMAEIQKQLRDKEAQKARNLLAMAMTHYEALGIVKKQIEEKLEKK